MNSSQGKKGLSPRQMDAIFKQLIDDVEIGIHVIDRSGKTIIYNQKMAEIESMKREDVLHKNVLEVFSFSRDQGSTLLEAVRTGKETRRVKQTYYNNKGKEITTINDTYPIRVDGEIIAAVEMAKDITKLEHVMKDNAWRNKNTTYTFDQIIGQSEAIRFVIKEAQRATRTSSSVLLAGETGTGKELFAQSIHNGSPRMKGPFIAQNCAAIPHSLAESILFGTKKGAFTGAVDQPGLFEQADGGTLLLDEIHALDPLVQAKLLRAIQEKTIRRVGDTRDKKVDVRILATINEDPVDAVHRNRLRKDLYYRLSVVTLYIPPLRERKEDLEPLAHHFIDKYNKWFHLNVQAVSPEAWKIFVQHDWPGNVRELEHVIEGAMNRIVDEAVMDVCHLPLRLRKKYEHVPEANRPVPEHSHGWVPEWFRGQTLQEKMEEAEKRLIQEALKENDGNITRTAKSLGISRQSLQYRMKKYHLATGETR
ncbi:sigma-54 interaction domain-containing protein [Thermoactinomyces vulgaris]|uniref:sigma-54 interaction domain-containing protein n=1 Tax=Thermoactinomyces vulgaris TaxID=2026 RepID=UPI003628DBB3